MENTEKQMSYQESLELIQSMIDTARNKVAEDGFHFIMWGTLVIICSLLNYGLIKTGYGNISYIPWLVMPFIGVPMAFYYEKQLKKEGHVKSHIEDLIKYVWLSYAITLVLSIFYSVYMNQSPTPSILMITGLATFTTGMSLKFKPLIAGGLIFWVLTVVCLFISPLDQLLVEAIGILFGYIIPGILLQKAAKAQSHV